MRILHIDTERGWRGGERQVLWLAEELGRQGHDSIIVARPGQALALKAMQAGLDVVYCAPRFEADPFAVLGLRQLVSRARIAIVHAHTAHAAGLGALATVGSKIPLVIARRVDFHLRRNPGTRWKYGRAAAIIAISRAVARILESDGIPLSRITIVPDGTDVNRQIAPAARETLQSLGVTPDAPLVVQIAQLVPHKDPLNFVRAVAAARSRVPTLQALLVGDGPLHGDVVEAIRALGLGETLHLAGYRQDADALLAAADVAVLSSREEGMGSVLLDALVLGKPIAATRAGGIPEVVDHDKTGMLAAVGEPVQLGDAIAMLLTDRTLAMRLAAAAKAHAPDFSLERLAARTLAVYDRVLDGDTVGEDAASRAVTASHSSSRSSMRAP